MNIEFPIPRPCAEIDRQVRRDQARATIRFLVPALWSNIAVAAITVLILWPSVPAAYILAWLSVLLTVTAGRYLVLQHARDAAAPERRPDDFLRQTSIGAGIAGLTWAALLIICDIVLANEVAMLLLILSGLAAGAVAIGPGHSPTSLAFAVPVLGAIIVGRLFIGMSGDLLSALVGVFFLFMLTRSSLQAQRDFIDGSRTKHAATALAEALQVANAETKAQAAMLEVLVNHDTLTGLASRGAFAAGISATLAGAGERRGSLLLIDLDHFKLINDTLGHGAGDGLLIEIATRLRGIVGDDALAARLGGDEFAVVIDDRGPAEAIAQEILDAIAQPLTIGNRSTKIGASIGIACFPEDGTTAEDLMARADLALYAAKAEGRQRLCRFDASLQDAAAVRRDIELDLSKALAEGAIAVWCQPQVALADRSVVGVELLIRWKHDRHGWIAPPDIVAAARSTHQSEALTLHVVTEACRLIRDLDERGEDNVIVAVNVSPQELGLYPLAARVAEILAAFNASPACLEVEITEDAAIAGDAAIGEIEALRLLGVRIAIDDFGSGYSSLASLRALRVDRIKIDRGFVTDIGRREGDRVLVQAILGIGRALGVEVVAEGVEGAEEALLLARYGCHVAQGYHFARPMPRPDFDAWMREAQAPATYISLRAQG